MTAFFVVQQYCSMAQTVEDEGTRLLNSVVRSRIGLLPKDSDKNTSEASLLSSDISINQTLPI